MKWPFALDPLFINYLHFYLGPASSGTRNGIFLDVSLWELSHTFSPEYQRCSRVSTAVLVSAPPSALPQPLGEKNKQIESEHNRIYKMTYLPDTESGRSVQLHPHSLISLLCPPEISLLPIQCQGARVHTLVWVFAGCRFCCALIKCFEVNKNSLSLFLLMWSDSISVI